MELYEVARLLEMDSLAQGTLCLLRTTPPSMDVLLDQSVRFEMGLDSERAAAKMPFWNVLWQAKITRQE